MTPRTFLIHGLVAGLLAGFAAFLVAHQIGEPPVDAAIAVEEAAAADTHDTDAGHHDEDDAVVSRDTQATWGLATGTLAIGTALGGLVALVSAAAVGRVGRLRPSQTTALVSVTGFVAVALVPFLKYPATPPAVGDAATIGERTTEYFVFLAVSVVTAVAATVLGARLLPALGGYRTLLAGAGGYLLVMVVTGAVMPTVNEIGGFPADTLWSFRVASLLTLVTLWTVLGVVLVGLVGRAHQRVAVEAARRELAASL